MAEKNNNVSFLTKLVSVFSLVVLILSIASSDLMESVANEELLMMGNVYGIKNTQSYIDSASVISDSLFYDSGMVGAVKSFILPKSFTDKIYTDKEYVPIYIWTYINEAIDNFMFSIHFSLVRICSFIGWLPLFILLMFGSIMSGVYQREIKKEGFEYSSPMRHGLAKKIILLLPAFSYVLILVPIATHPYIIPLVVALTSMFCGWFAANTIKRL